MEKRASTVCLDANRCQHYSSSHLLDDSIFVGGITRMERLTPAKIEAIVNIVRAILNDELNRQSSYIGLDIFQDAQSPKRLQYARTYSELKFTEYGQVPTIHFLEFQEEGDAAAYAAVLTGILTLGLTPFKVSGKEIAYHGIPGPVIAE